MRIMERHPIYDDTLTAISKVANTTENAVIEMFTFLKNNGIINDREWTKLANEHVNWVDDLFVDMIAVANAWNHNRQLPELINQ